MSYLATTEPPAGERILLKATGCHPFYDCWYEYSVKFIIVAVSALRSDCFG
jgi:hypothetical protein